MKQLVRRVHQAALAALVLVLLASTLAAIPGALAASPSYTLTGYVHQPGGAPVPAGVQVDLVSRPTGTVYTTTTFGGGGQFVFTSSSTSGALAPGYWGLWVPSQGNASFAGCKPCAALPQNQNPMYSFLNSSALTTSFYPTILSGVSILTYTTTVSGTVTYGGNPVVGANVRLLDPAYNGLVLANNSTVSGGAYNFKAPSGTWVIQATQPGPLPNYSNESSVVVSGPTTVKNLVINQYLVSGTMKAPTGGPVPSSGNATLYDGYNGYIYSYATSPGGYYALGTYPGNFTSGSQSFDVILASVGYSTSSYPLVVVSGTPVVRDVTLPTVRPSQLGVYNTTLDFSQFNVTAGTGNLSVQTVASLGNDTVLPNLPNATVGQLWAQLGLDFGHSLTFSSALLGSVYSWANSTGPFFPAVQAGTAINGTPFVGPTSPETLSSYSSGCTSTCGLSSSANLNLAWSEKYALNSTVYKDSSSYTLGFNFRHPSSYETYNYTVVLPTGFVLKSGTTVPANSRLVPAGPGGTWTKFTLVSLPSPSPGGSFQFTIVKYSSLTAIVNATVTNFAFSSHNVLNSTNGNYTVEVGVNQNVTLSALNSIYPAGTNGTKFTWTFGDGTGQNVTTPTTYHYYATASTTLPEAGTLTVTSSGGLTNSTTFYVWVAAAGQVTAGVAWNATAQQNRSVGGTTYVFVNWSTTLQFNATASVAQVSSTMPGIVAVASYSLVSSGGFKQTANYSISQGSSYLAFTNWSVQFLGAGSYLSSGSVNGHAVAFKGWQYNLTLTVWSATGQSASQTLVVLVNDTEKPVSAFQLLNPAGKVVSGTGIIAGANASARVQLNGGNASDPHNGTVSRYYWLVTNSADSSVHMGVNTTSVKPYPSMWLYANTTAYTVNLTVWDQNGNSGYATQTLTVSVNSSTTPIMAANNLTGPTSLTAGTSYTYWVNVTTGGGSKSVAQDVRVQFYTSPSGSTSKNPIAGSPGSVKFYNYTSPGVPNSVSFATGTVPTLAYNTTVRATVSWTPVITGNYVLYANVTATNQFSGNSNLPSVTSVAITVSPSSSSQYLEYAAVAVVVVVIILVLVFWVRRRGRTTTSKPSSRRGLERGGKRSDDDHEDDDKDDDA
ncbi:MAG: DUF1416 domain-containing protein [Thermoplasmata archaeon]